MELVIFGLSISSSWGNGHATIWRGLINYLIKTGSRVTFFEKDVPYYANHRDYTGTTGLQLIIYKNWNQVQSKAEKIIKNADVAIVTSYCSDAIVASQLIFKCNCNLKVFYDLDTPVTLENIRNGEYPPYICPDGLGKFDLVLSYTGGIALDLLKSELGAKVAIPLYGCADPQIHYPTEQRKNYESYLSYLGTYAKDRQLLLEELFLKPARVLKDKKFILAGAQYPQEFPWTSNIYYLPHISPPEHPFFYSSSTFTLNVTRSAMARMGYCPSGRLFEAALCGVPIISDIWIGIETFFEPMKEIILVESAEDVLEMFQMTEDKRRLIAEAARSRVLRDHTAQNRAQELLDIINRF